MRKDKLEEILKEFQLYQQDIVEVMDAIYYLYKLKLPPKMKDSERPDIESKEIFDLYKNGYNQAIDEVKRLNGEGI